MKRKNYKRKLISYIVIWSVVLSSLLFSSPDNIMVSASDVPKIQILTPTEGVLFNALMVEVTGTTSDDLTTSDKLSIKVFEQLVASQQPTDITDEGQLTITPKDNFAEFSYSKDFTEGAHTLTFVVTDEDGVSTRVDRSFTVKLDANVLAEETPATAETPAPAETGSENPITSTENNGSTEETTPKTAVGSTS
ncbi:MAG: hypothetical protein ACJ8MO_22220, partial [Bacillus sp. (in: firmicutes)]